MSFFGIIIMGVGGPLAVTSFPLALVFPDILKNVF